MRNKLSLLLVLVVALVSEQTLLGQQNVLLDFDSGTDANINYSAASRNQVQSTLETIYQDFDINFFQTSPTTGPFTTLTFNSGTPGGLADGIDFRNLNQSDNAVINAAGLGLTSTADIIGISGNIAAHELGHLLGLRHRDSFGPIGSGIFAGLPGGAGNLNPIFPGPTNATEFGNHVLSTPAFGASVARFAQPVWLSERSAIKLTHAEQGTVVAESAAPNNTLATAQSLTPDNLLVPNTIVAGQNAGVGPFFDVDTLSVTGSITAGDIDLFQFEAEAGDLFNFEVSSSSNVNIANSFDTQLSILDSSGNFVDYFGTNAFNDDEIESFDSVIFDLVLPADGTYFIQVNGFAAGSAGDYELFFSRFNGGVAVPEPTSMAVLLGVAAIAGLRRRRS